MANYHKTEWQDLSLPALDANKMNYIEAGIENAQADMTCLRGLAANRPASVRTLEGRLYFDADDPFAIWRDTGAAWEQVGYAFGGLSTQIMRGLAADRPASDTDMAGRLYYESDAPYWVWRQGAADWEHAAFAASADPDVAFHDLSVTLDDPGEYGVLWYGDKRTITLNPDAYEVKLHRGLGILMNSDPGCVTDISDMEGLYFDVNHYGVGSIVLGMHGITGSIGNYGTVNTHGIAMTGYAYNAGIALTDFRCARFYMVNEGPGSTPTYVGTILEADGIMSKITNKQLGQITRAYVLVSHMENQDVGSVVGTFLGSTYVFDNEGTVTTANYGLYESPTNTGTVDNWAALYFEDQNGIGGVTNYLLYSEGGVSRLIQNMAAAPGAPLELVQDHLTGAVPCLTLDQDDISEGFLDLLGSDRGVIPGVTNSVASARVELNGVVLRAALYADA